MSDPSSPPADLPFRVERSIDLPAPPPVVWSFLTEPDGWAAVWGAGSTIDPRPGGPMLIVYPNGQTAEGEVLTVDAPQHLAFTYGYDRPDPPIPVGGSRVTIRLSPTDRGTRLILGHEVAEAPVADQHGPGWRYQMGLLRNVVARGVHGDALPGRIDAWHEAWSIEDPTAARAALADVVTDDVHVVEPGASLHGVDDLIGFTAQSRMHLPGTLHRVGPPLLDGDQVLWDWRVEIRGAVIEGHSVARLVADGRFDTVTAFWRAAPPGIPTSCV